MNDSRRVIYVASPLRGNYDLHVQMAKVLARELHVISDGRMIPFVPHLHFTQYLDDGDEIQRGVGMDAARYMLRVCDELWIFDGLGVSNGMLGEEEEAKRIGLPIKRFPTLTHWKATAASEACVVDAEWTDHDNLSHRAAKRWERAAEIVSARELATLDALARIIAPDSFAGRDGIENMGKVITERTQMAVSEVMDLREKNAGLEEQVTKILTSRNHAVTEKKRAEERLENSKTELSTAWAERTAAETVAEELTTAIRKHAPETSGRGRKYLLALVGE